MFHNRRFIITMHWESFTCYITSWQPGTAPYIGKYEPKQTLSKLPTDELTHRSPLKLVKQSVGWNIAKNKSVINVRPVSVGIYDLLTSQVAYFPHLPQLLAPGSQLASPLQILACNWCCFTVNWTTLHTTGLADMAPATPSHGPGLQSSPCGIAVVVGLGWCMTVLSPDVTFHIQQRMGYNCNPTHFVNFNIRTV